MEITIKPIEEDAIDEFHEVFKTLIYSEFPELTEKTRRAIPNSTFGGWTKNAFKQNIKNKNYTLLGAWSNNTLIGLLDAWYQAGGVCFLSWLMVNSAFQRKGVGKKLVETLEQEVKTRGFHLIYLYADERNIPFYENKLGYTNSGFIKHSWFNTDNYIFTKLIQTPNEEIFIQ